MPEVEGQHKSWKCIFRWPRYRMVLDKSQVSVSGRTYTKMEAHLECPVCGVRVSSAGE